jgi:hypothetical protein
MSGQHLLFEGQGSGPRDAWRAIGRMPVFSDLRAPRAHRIRLYPMPDHATWPNAMKLAWPRVVFRRSGLQKIATIGPPRLPALRPDTPIYSQGD